MRKSVELLMNEIRERLESLEASLPERLDAMAVSHSKLPWKPVLYRETLRWRMAELGRAALENFERDCLAAAIILTRATVEGSAALWHLQGKVAAAIDANELADIDEYLMRLIMGSKTESTLPQAVNVLSFVDRVDKDIPGFRHQYDVLSEYAHPNWAGTSLLYSKHDQERLVTDFGKNVRKLDGPKDIGIVNLSVSLAMFERGCDLLSELMPAFTALCESNLKAQGA